MSIVKGSKKGSGQARQPNIAPDSAQSKTRINILYGLAEGEIEGLANGNKSILLENTPLEDNNGKLNFESVKVDFRSGTNDQDYIEGFPAVESETAVDVELKAGTPWVKSFKNLDLDALRIRLKWGPLRTQDATSGDVSGVTIEYAVELQTDGGPWTEVLKTKISDKTSANYERAHRINLPKADSDWLIRVRRITPNSTSEYVSDKMYIEAVTEIIDAKLRYPNTALLGLQYDAETFNNVAKIAVECKGTKIKLPSNYNPVSRTYAGMWDGTFISAYSNNPAWVYYDICTSDRYGLGDRLTPFMIDKWSLYRLGQYCDESVNDGQGGQEPRFTCNVYLQRAEEAYEILKKLAGVFRAISYWDGNSIICDADIPQDTYFTYTRANVIGEFEYSGTRARDRHNVVKVAFDNPANHYKTEYEYVRDEQAISDSGQVRILDLNAWGCTSRGQAQRAGLWALKSEQSETRTVTFKVGLDGWIPQPGRVIEIADELFAGRANGGRVSTISEDRVNLTIDRDDVVAKPGDRLVVNGENGKAQTRIIQSINGRVITVTLPFDLGSIAAENIWVIDAQDLATMKFRVISIRQEEKNKFTINAIQYNSKKFDEIDSGAYFEEVPISVINPTIQDPVSDILITSENKVNQGINITTMILSWKQAKGAVKYFVEWRKDNGSWLRLPLTGNNSLEVQGVYSGNYQARVTAISAFEVSSLPVYSSITELIGKKGLPPKLEFIRATGILFGMQLDWSFPNVGAQDAAYVEIRVSPDGVSNIAPLGQFAYPTNTHKVQGLQPNLIQYYSGRIVDKIGNVGAWSEWVNGTTIANPEAVLDLISGHIAESDLAQELQGKIENTVNVAEAAEQAATNAQTAANSAQTAASNAQTAATEAKTAATNAQTAASTAQTQATNAQQVANEASATAANAKNAAEQAASTALTASNVATNAKNAADTAKSMAESATTAAANANTAATNAQTTATNAQKTATDAATAASKVASDLTTSTNQLNQKIADETSTRTTAISQMKDGLTTETTQRKSEDAALLSNIETYKSSTNNSLASLQTQITTNATNTSANTSKISSLDSRLTTNEGKTADAITSAATAQQTANTAVTNAAAAASAVTSLKSELSTGKGINNIVAPYSDPQELSANILGASRTVALVNSLMRVKGKAYDVTFTAAAGNIYFGSASTSTVNTTAAGSITGGKGYMLSAYFKNLDVAKQADVYISLLWFRRAADGTVSTAQATLQNQATGNLRVTPTNDGGTISFKAVTAPADAFAFSFICTGNGTYNVVGSRILIDMLMLEEYIGDDKPASTWTAGPADLGAIKSALDANASAISTLTTRVTNDEGVITSQGNSITQLNNSITTINGTLTNKADGTALNALTNRVSNAEGVITSQGNSITQLNNSVNSINGTLSDKADATALNSLTNRVTTAEGQITAQGSAIVSIKNDLVATNNALSTKADSSALNTLDSKVTSIDGRVTSNAGAITSLKSELSAGKGSNLLIAPFSDPQVVPYTATKSGVEVSLADSTLRTGKAYNFKNLTANISNYVYIGNYSDGRQAPVAVRGGTKLLFSFYAKADVAGFIGRFALRVFNQSGASVQVVTLLWTSTQTQNVSFTTDLVKYTLYLSSPIHADGVTASILLYTGGASSAALTPAGAILTMDKLMIEEYVGDNKDGSPWVAGSADLNGIYASLDASATAVSNLTTRVTNAEGTLTSQGNSITSLRNDLTTTNSNVSKKADASALTSLDTKVTSIDGRVTTNTNVVTALQGRVTTVEGGLSTKADASALNNFYTKTEADSATSGAIDAFNSQLTIGGVNAVANSEAPRTSTAASNKEYLLYERSAELKAFYDENLDKPVTISFEMSVPIAGAVQVYSSNGSAHHFVTSVVAVIPNQFIKYSVTVNPRTNTASTTVSTIEFYGTYGTGRIPTIRKLQIEAGNKATAWSPSPRDTQAALDANASAIQTTQTKVDNIDGRLTTATESITSLSSRMATAEGNITSTNGAVSGLSTRMATAEGKITNQSDSITSLQNSVNSINGTLANKADSSAVTNLTSRVSTAEGNITSQGNSITSLNNSLAVSGKGGTNLLIKSNVVGTYNGVAYPHHVYQLGEDWEVGAKYTLLWCADHTRGAGDNSSYLAVYAGGGNQYVQEVANSNGKVVRKITFTKSSSGVGKVINFYMINRPTADKNTVGTIYWAVLVKGDVITTDAWIPSSYDYLPDVTANASAISNLTNTVTQQGNTITSHSNSITSLNNSITSINGSLANKAESSALQSLDSKVTTIDGKVTSNTSALTALQSSFDGLPNQGVNLLGPEISNPVEKPTNWVSGLPYEVVSSTDTVNVRVFQFTMPAASGSGMYFNIGGGQVPRQWLTEGKYIFSFVAKTVDGTPPHPIDWLMYNVSATRLRFNITATLTRYSGVFTVPAGGAAACMLLIGNPTAKAAGQVVVIERMMLERQVGSNTTPSTWIAGSDPSGMIISTQAKATDLFNTATNQNSATAGRVTSLESRMTSTEGALSTKADASALQTLDTKVTNVDGKVTSNTNAITSLNSALTNATSTISMNAGSPLADWTTYAATGEFNVIAEATGQSGKVIQLGNNAGNDTIWLHANNLIPFDQTKTYRIRARYRRRAGSGTIYLGIAQKTSDKAWYVTTGNTQAANMASSNYVVNAHAPVIDEWQEIVGYYKGRSAGAATGSGSLASPRTASQMTGFISPLFIANYQNQAGIVELDYLILEDAEAIAGNQANATALNTLDTKVTEVDGRLATATNSITSLGSRMSTAEGNISAANTALSGLSTRMTAAEGGLTNQSNSITSLTNSINSFDSDSLIPDYNLANPEKWISHYGYDMKQYFKTTTTGKVGNTVFRKDTSVPVNCFNYSLSAVPNDRTYRISFWVRCSSDSNGSLSIPVMYGYADGLWTTSRYTALGIPAAMMPTKDGNWYFVSVICNLTSNTTIQQMRFGIAPGHTGTAGWWEVQGYKVSPVLTTADADSSFATSAALSSLTSTVSQQGSTITSQSTDITNLKNSVTSINGTLTNKADASAVNTLSNRVTAAEGNITSQGNSITSLNNTLANNDLSNLILNPDFIDPKSGWTAGVIVDATDAAPNPPSPKALKLTNRDSYYGPFVKCNVGDMFYVSGWFATPNTSATATAVIGLNTRNASAVNGWYTVAAKSTDKTTWTMVEGYFTIPAGAVEVRPWLQVSIAAADAAAQLWHVTNIQVRNITGNKKLASDLQATSSALSTLDSKVTNIDGRVTSSSNNIVTLNNSVTNINTALSQKADASAISSLSNRVTTAEGNISSQGSSITSLTNNLAVTTNTANAALPKIQGGTGAAKLFRGVLVFQQNGANVVGNIVIQTPITFTSKMFRLALTGYNYLAGKTDINLNIGGYAYTGTSIIQHGVVNSGTLPTRVRLGVRNGTVVVILTSQAPNAYWQYPNFNIDAEIGYTTPPDDWINGWSASLVAEADLASSGISAIVEPSLLDVSTEITANASAISNLTNTVTQQGGTITSHSNSITSLNNSITSINGALNTKASTSAVTDLDSRVTTAEGKITANTSSITSLTANLKNVANGITMSASLDVDPDSEWIYWTKNGEVARADDTSALGGKVYRFGNNAGNDHVNARSKAKLPFDQTKTYRIRARYRRLSGTGTVYCAVCCLALDGISHVNSSNTVSTDFGSSNYFVINQSPTNNVWQEVTVYVKGRSTGAATGSWTLAAPRQMPNATAFLSVQFLANYSNAAGMTELDYIIIEDADAIAANDATANALSSLDTRVTTAEGKITSQGSSITSLNNSITTINGTLSTKADSSALTNLANRVTVTENSITTQGSSITSLNASVSGLLKDVEVTDTRSTNQPPSWYWTNYPKRIVREFKQASTIGLTGMGTYVSLETYVYYGDATGGPIIQIARGTDSKLTAERRSASASTWGTWSQDIKTLSDGLANKAEASALSTLDAKVTTIDGKVSTQATSITNLTTTVGGHTASIQSQQESIDGLKARATLKLQSGNLVGGVGIENDSKTVDFIIQANRFAIGAPSTVTGTVTPKYAFSYQSTPMTLPNGTVIPAGLYLDNASIGYINANKINADSLSAISATLGTLTTYRDPANPNGARMVLTGSLLEVYDDNNVMRVRLGLWD
ncbi:TipJ family phage tail tip protein [Acinetobacter lactucae]|uniref:TipJ family phage tail tip protein n=1 Tax=Acinetobacter lactucae TaxID=1785128 RepID=UPI00148BFEB8|nr:phage tail protein [Acinetobacter lactucae]